MKINRLALGLIIASAGCGASTSKKASGSGGPQPDWVGGQSSRYPRDLYVTGAGSGDDRASSEDSARAGVSKVFSTAVDVVTSVSESEEIKGADGKNASDTFAQSISQNLKTTSKQLLEGVEIVDNWQDQAARRYYALAALERQKGLSMVSEKIADFDKQAGEWKVQMDQASERLPRVKAAMKLLALFKAREALNAQARVLDSGGRGIPNPLNEAQVRPQAAKALASLDVVLSVSGDDSAAVRTGILKGLNAFGLQAKSGGPDDAADINVSANVETNPLEGDATAWKWGRSTVTISLKEGKTGKVFLQFDASERGSAVHDQREALRRTLAKLAAAAAEKVGGAITDFFENQ